MWAREYRLLLDKIQAFSYCSLNSFFKMPQDAKNCGSHSWYEIGHRRTRVTIFHVILGLNCFSHFSADQYKLTDGCIK